LTGEQGQPSLALNALRRAGGGSVSAAAERDTRSRPGRVLRHAYDLISANGQLSQTEERNPPQSTADNHAPSNHLGVTPVPRAFDRKRLRAARRDLRLNQRQFADLVGCSWHSITAYERGARTPLADTLVRIADTLGMPIDEFFSDKAQRPRS
jgi:DNA-binding XRE family transcriptional regulator